MGKEHYRGQPMAAGSSASIGGAHMAGFLCTVVGTITVTEQSGEVLLDAMPLALGFNRIPLLFDTSAGAIISLGDDTAGTLLL